MLSEQTLVRFRYAQADLQSHRKSVFISVRPWFSNETWKYAKNCFFDVSEF